MIPKRIRHKGICEHPQTPYARRKCRAEQIAAKKEKVSQMIKTITVELPTPRRWGAAPAAGRTVERIQIDGTITAIRDDRTSPQYGPIPIYTVQAGDVAVTVAHISGLDADYRPVQVGDSVRIIASTEPPRSADYLANRVEVI